MVKTTTDIAIIGVGLTGKLAGLAFAQKHPNLSIALIGPQSSRKDDRAFFLSHSSVNLLQALGLMDSLPHQNVTGMDIRDGTAGQASQDAFPLLFGIGDRPSDDGIDAPLGILVEAKDLNAAVDKALTSGAANHIHSAILSVSNHNNSFAYECESGAYGQAGLGILADGRHSPSRRQLGIENTALDYKQMGVVSVLTHTQDHKGVAYQSFLSGGPFATLPLTKSGRSYRSALVWTLPTRAAKAAMALSQDDLLVEISKHLPSALGKLKAMSPVQGFPLILQVAKQYAVPHAALIGDSAHVIHPLAGQGLNLGIRDIAALVDVVTEAKSTGMQLGGAPMMGDYERWRRFDGAQLAAATDSLSRLYKAKLPIIGHARRAGMSLINAVPPVKSAIMAEASGTSGQIPTLLQ